MNNNFDDDFTEHLEKIKEIVSDYNEFCKAAEKLEWLEIHEEHYDWCTGYVASVHIHYFKFPEDYLKNNLKDAYVRTIMSDISFYEEWDKDIWKNISVSDRTKHLTEGEKFYKAYSSIGCPCFKRLSFGHLKDEIDLFRKKDIDTDEYHKCIGYIEDAFIVELGGYYAEDHTCLAIKEDTMTVIDYGAWD